VSRRVREWIAGLAFALFAGLLFISGRSTGATQVALAIAAGACLLAYFALSNALTRERLDRARRGLPDDE
jgi:drug/metabolite transporter (DMT)-like permease